MRHPHAESIVRHADGTLSANANRRVAEHIASCALCTESMDWMRDIRAAAALATTLTAPATAWTDIESRLQLRDTVMLPTDNAASPSRARVAAIAAGLVLCASVAAALVPQTGVRIWLEQLLGAPAAVPSPAAPASDPAVVVAEMAVSPVNGVVHVELTAPAAPLQLRVRLGAGTDLEILAARGAATARFIAGVGRIEIDGASNGEILLVLPRSARLVTVDVDGVRAVEARGSAMTVLVPRADTVGTELILPVR